MTDTTADIERMVRERLMARSPEERFRMGAEMFDAAVTMILASLPPDLPVETRRRRLFQRLYGTELPTTTTERGQFSTSPLSLPLLT